MAKFWKITWMFIFHSRTWLSETVHHIFQVGSFRGAKGQRDLPTGSCPLPSVGMVGFTFGSFGICESWGRGRFFGGFREPIRNPCMFFFAYIFLAKKKGHLFWRKNADMPWQSTGFFGGEVVIISDPGSLIICWDNLRLHPGRLTWNLQITHLERKMIFQTSTLIFHVNLQGCNMEHGHGGLVQIVFLSKFVMAVGSSR